MPREVTITLQHDLGVDGARQRLEEGFGKIKSALGGGMMMSFEESWDSAEKLSFRAKGMGQTITGVVDVFPAHVRITALLPGVLASLAELISGKVEKEGRLLLEKK